MFTRNASITFFLFSLSLTAVAAWAHDDDDFPQKATFSTLLTMPLPIEGMTGDNRGNLYVPGRATVAGAACPVWRVDIQHPAPVVVGMIPAPSATGLCAPMGLAFDQTGKLFVTQTDRIYSFFPNADAPPTATLFASNVPGTNGLAFDRDGNLWTGDGTTGQGRVWKITANGTVTEVFRIQPMANEVNLVAGVGGVGRDVRNLGPGTITVTPTTRNAANTTGSQPLVANGLAFDKHGDLLITDTARGAIWKARFDRRGNLQSSRGCDTTFSANTLCLENVVIGHPYLEGADGIVLDEDDNIWIAANERNAIIGVTRKGEVLEVFRNAPDAVTRLRNVGPLEFPTSPVLSDRKFCVASFDVNRRDNSPNTAGEISAQNKGKISCMDQKASERGAALPAR
jgi:sugar lactone lactonase YvrE